MINEYIINQLYKKFPVKNQNEYFLKLKRKASKKFGVQNPTNIELLKTYRKMIKNNVTLRQAQGDINKNIENLLVTKKMRTLSGVAVIAVLTKPYKCPGTCQFCPNEKDMPKSYLSNEPAVMRAILTDFHPYRQVIARLNSLKATGHKTDKIELIIMGGTFSYLPKQYQTWFVKECFRACNACDDARWLHSLRRAVEPECEQFAKKLHSPTGLWSQHYNLQQLQKQNEKSKHRIIGLTLETRPDYIDEGEIIRMRKLGATRVELGVQSIYDDVLKLNKRGHSVATTIEATRLLKKAGFKINYHMMPNLPGSSCKRDLEMFKELFSNQDFQPDMLKIYPCVVVKNAPIYKWLKTGKYKPYSDQELLKLLAEIKKIIPYYVRITRVIRDIPTTSIVAGNKISNLRQVLQKKSAEEGWSCKCIRCREVRDKFKTTTPLTPTLSRGERELQLFRQNYNASDGKEIFLSFEDRDRKNIYSLLRLRINKNNTAIIREVHTYGQMMPIKSKNKKSPQHIGLGKKLILEAERITAQEFNLKKITVISGVGVRDYYRKLGYRLENGYMIKKL